MIYAILKHSNRKDKKLTAYVFINNKKYTINFGQSGYEDYVIHNDKERKKNYIARHSAISNFNDPTTAGFWSRWILWNKPTIEESMKDVMNRFRIPIIFI